MTRLLVIGGSGMLGHKLWQTADATFETWGAVRRVTPALRQAGIGQPERTVEGVDAHRPDTVETAIERVRPDAVVNCVGVVKQLAAAKDPVESIAINALHPHVVARMCLKRGIRFVHISTDCVFDGARGHYSEADRPDATDLYGRSKALGEVTGPGCLTIRTSIIGRELSGASGLVEWFLSRRGGSADGYEGAVFSGLTTEALSELLVSLLATRPTLEGLYHVSADPIDKHALLGLLNHAFNASIAITRKSDPRIDRSLDSTAFRLRAGFTPPSWPAMIAALAADATPYEKIRQGQGVTG